MKLQSLREVERALVPYYEVAKHTTGKGITVERIARLMAHLGHPEEELTVVHVAGTSGKTSTTSYIAALLKAAGRTVGHTVSPHVISLTERVQIDGRPLEEARFCELMGEFLDIVADASEAPSWFELMIAFALWVFAREKVDYAVLETGMGGLHDATNVCDLPDKVCVITDIGLDHTQWLGSTLVQIAGQKAGIIHPGNAVFMYEQAPEIMQVVKFKANQTKKAELYIQHEELLAKIYDQEFDESLPLYQRRNWLLAYAVYRYLIIRDGLPLISVDVLRTTQIPVAGRMENIEQGDKTIILDGAHNTPKMRAFVDSFKARYGERKVPVLIALKKDKEEAEIGPIIAEISSEIIVTAFHGSQDWPIEAQDPQYLAAVMKHHVEHVSMTPTSTKGLEHLLSTESNLLVVTGSLYLVTEIRARLLKG
jgi:dihydrofolate synthase/folylpolyglutamate synthase